MTIPATTEPVTAPSAASTILYWAERLPELSASTVPGAAATARYWAERLPELATSTVPTSIDELLDLAEVIA